MSLYSKKNIYKLYRLNNCIKISFFIEKKKFYAILKLILRPFIHLHKSSFRLLITHLIDSNRQKFIYLTRADLDP